MKEKIRIEHDSLGEVTVPQHALYGAQTQRAIQNFPISGLVMPRRFIQALGLIKQACAEVNEEQGGLHSQMAQAIIAAASAVAKGEHDEHFPVDVFQTGSGTSSNMNANEVIAHLASDTLKQKVHPNDHVNMGQSSNDVIPSAIHLSCCLAVSKVLLPALQQLVQTIDSKAASFKDVIKTGRTHLMDAMPLTLAQEMSAWSSQIQNNIDRLEACMPRLTQLAIGGTAVGTGVNTTADFGTRVAVVLSQLTGLSLSPKANAFEGLSSQDTAAELSGILKIIAISFSKISNDLRWMSSGPLAGLAEITLPALQPGSSIMPAKVNPVIPEAVAMVAAQVVGNDATISMAAQSGNFQLNVMLPVIVYNLLQSIEILATGAVCLAGKAIQGMQANREIIQSRLQKNPILVTALVHEVGYEKCAEIAKQAYQSNRSILELAKELTDLDEQTLSNLLNPENLIGEN